MNRFKSKKEVVIILKIKVSIIVPVHNTEKYLSKCLDSLVNQTLQEIEIVLINDCSTDGSMKILEDYKNKYGEKIILINLEKNLGPGGARNMGIERASGEYLGFVDSDDHVEPDMFEEMYEIAESGNYDMVDCAYSNKHIFKDFLTIGQDVWGQLDTEKRKKLIVNPGYIWSKIIKRSIFIDNNLRFRENVKYEDIDFTRILCLYINNVSGTDMIYYFYEQNEDSITNSEDIDIQIKSRIIAIRALVDKFKELGVYETYKEELTFVIYTTYADMIKSYSFGVELQHQSYDVYKNLREFFFSLVNYDYHDNKYILQIDKKKLRMYAELNNADYKLIMDTLMSDNVTV